MGLNEVQKQITRKKWQTILSVCLFLLVFAVVFHYVSERVRLKKGIYNNMYGFYREPEDTLDVVFVGSSHMYRGVSPMYLWERYGIPSYDVCTSAQGILDSYYVIREMLRFQHPKAIVLDVYGAQYDKVTHSLSKAHAVTDAMAWSRNKMDMFRNYLMKYYSQDSLKELLFPFLTYHSRWDELEWADFREGRSSTKGCALTFATKEETQPPDYEAADTVPGILLEYLDKILFLCQENGIDLILCQIPMGEWDGYQNQREKMRYFMDYGEAHGAKVIDFSQMVDEIGIDFAADFKDVGHLNARGTYKITDYFGEYLKEQYQLPDHRGEELYEQWDVLLPEYWALYQQKQNAGNTEDEEDSLE